MNHLLRLTWLLVTAPFRAPVQDFLSTTRIRLRVWPTDLDIQMHMNNGVYFSLLDLGRIDLLLKSRAYLRLTRAGFYPVVQSEAIRFRRSLRLFQAFEVHTKMLGWDERDFYIRQDFRVHGELYAAALIKGCFLKRGTSGKRADPKELFQLLNVENRPMTLGEGAHLLRNLEQELRD